MISPIRKLPREETGKESNDRRPAVGYEQPKQATHSGEGEN